MLISTSVRCTESSGTIRGQIFDAVAFNPLSGVSVAVVGTELQTSTDSLGWFTISDLTAGNHQIIISRPDYRSLMISAVADKAEKAPAKSWLLTREPTTCQKEREKRNRQLMPSPDSKDLKSQPKDSNSNHNLPKADQSYVKTEADGQIEKGALKGIIVDADTDEPIMGASAIIEGTTAGGMTDPDGKFFIWRLAPRIYKLRFTHLEYETVTLDSVEVGFAEIMQIAVKLTKKPEGAELIIEIRDQSHTND